MSSESGPAGAELLQAVANMLKQQLQALDEQYKFYQEKYENMQELMEIAKKRARGEKLTRDEVAKAMSITCYGHIAYCCGIEKRCPFRDAALAALGISHEEFKAMKEKKVEEGLKELGVI